MVVTRSRLLIPALVIVLSCSSLPIAESSWTSDPGTVPASAWQTDKDSGIQWSVSNDAAYLYLTVRIEDRSEQMLIRRRGLQVFFDPTGGKSENVAIRYPYTEGPDQLPGEGEFRQTPPLSTEMLWSRGNDETILNPTIEKTEFRASIQTSPESSMRYALRIPLDSLRAEPSGEPVAIAVGFSLKPPDRRNGQRGEMRPDTGERPPGGDMSGGGMPSRGRGGRRGGEFGGRRPDGGTSERTVRGFDVWFLAKLAGGPVHR